MIQDLDLETFGICFHQKNIAHTHFQGQVARLIRAVERDMRLHSNIFPGYQATDVGISTVMMKVKGVGYVDFKDFSSLYKVRCVHSEFH